MKREVSLEAAPSVLWDAVVVLDGGGSAEALSQSGHAMEFLKDQYRHCKPILLLGAAATLAAKANLPAEMPTSEADPGLLRFAGDDVAGVLPAFVEAPPPEEERDVKSSAEAAKVQQERKSKGNPKAMYG